MVLSRLPLAVVVFRARASVIHAEAWVAATCERHADEFACFEGVLSEAGEAIKQEDPCESLPPDTPCYHDIRIWKRALARVSQCLLRRPEVLVNENLRLQCDQMRRMDPSVVQVDQSHCYPDEYFNAIPSAAYLLDRYPINLRPKSTDLDVLQQVRRSVLENALTAGHRALSQ